MNNFPYPVLLVEESSYKEDVRLELEYIDSIEEDETIQLKFNIHLQAVLLRKLYDEGKIGVKIKIETSTFSITRDITTSLDKQIKLRFNNDRMLANDLINVTVFLVAAKPFELLWCEELLERYPKSLRHSLRKNDILAISNRAVLDYSRNSENFIKLSESKEQEGKGIKIALGENYVQIKVGPSFNLAYARMKNDANVRDLINSHLLFEAFTFIFCELVQKPEDYKETEWYKTLDHTFEYNGMTLEEFVERSSDSESIDLDFIYGASQHMVNNQVEESLVKVSNRSESDA